jgi:hypothetical protein
MCDNDVRLYSCEKIIIISIKYTGSYSLPLTVIWIADNPNGTMTKHYRNNVTHDTSDT